jgi:hypothetical protein
MSPTCIVSQRREDDERVTVGVPAAEVVQVDLIFARSQRQRVSIGSPREEPGVGGAELRHLRHARSGVLMDDAFDRGAEEAVAARVIAVSVRIDGARDRLVGDGLDPLEDGRPESRQLAVDQGDAGVGDEHRDVAAAERVLVLAPEPVRMYRLSLTFSIYVALIAAADGPCAWPDTGNESAPTPINVPSTSPVA